MALKWFNNFIKYGAVIIMGLAAVSSIAITLFLNVDLSNLGRFFVNLCLILLISAFLFVFYIKRKEVKSIYIKITEKSHFIFYLILIAFIIRLLWVLLVQTTPVSDFKVMYNTAKAVSHGSYKAFHGTNYFARFAHDTIPILYYAMFYKISTAPLLLIKLTNVIFSTAAVYALYSAVNQLTEKRIAIAAAVLMSFFPPLIMYNSQVVTENMAILFYIASIYAFAKFLNSGRKASIKYGWLILSGITLSAGNMFRMVGIVFVTAYVLWFLLYKGIISGIKALPFLIISYIVPLLIVSNLLLSSGITEVQLWDSKEPFWTSVLKGSNFNSGGLWNEEDAALPSKYNFDTEVVKQESIKIIEQRLFHTNPIKVAGLYIFKLGVEMSVCDYGAYLNTTSENNYFRLLIMVTINAYYILILYLSIIYMKVAKKVPEEINFVIILIGGFLALYLISEVQPRYMFIVSWAFTVIAAMGLKGKVYDTIY